MYSVGKVISALVFKYLGFFIKNLYNKSLMLLSYTKEIANGMYKADKKCKEVEICQLLISKGHAENERQKKFFCR